MAEKEDKILGFQFEPCKKRTILRRDQPGEESDSSWESVDFSSDDEEANIRYARCNKPAASWCRCGQCQPMSTEEECFCCQELNSIGSLFDGINGKNCFFHMIHINSFEFIIKSFA